jgi:hypothetical protein
MTKRDPQVAGVVATAFLMAVVLACTVVATLVLSYAVFGLGNLLWTMVGCVVVPTAVIVWLLWLKLKK